MTQLQSLSIILEWETAGECGTERSAACLAALHDEIRRAGAALSAPPEVIVAADPGQAARREVEHALRTAARGGAWPCPCRVVQPPRPLDYYRKKNFGFTQSRGDLVLFFDSDLVPEPGWLLALTKPFEDPAKSVVVGRTHFETRTLYERAVALFWIFDERLERDEVRPTRRLVSNNIAFRRALFAALPFPERPTYRGQCSELGAKLGRLGVAMYEATAARASHPAPAGLGAFSTRAFRAGRDACAYRQLEGPAGIRDWLAEWRRDLGSVRARIRARAPAIGAGPMSIAAAAALGALYYSIKAAGFVTKLRQAPARGPATARPAEPSR